MTTEILVPTLGESVTEATVAKWLRQPGEQVAQDEPLVELETDKVTLEVNAPEAGSLVEVLAPEESEVEVGGVLATFAVGTAGSVAPAPPTTAAPTTAAPTTAAPMTATPEAAAGAGSRAKTVVSSGAVVAPALKGTGESGGITRADLLSFLKEGAPSASLTLSPAVSKLVRENGLNPNLIRGTGRGGAITKGDVLAFLENPPAERILPAVTPAAVVAESPPKKEREHRERMPRMRQTIAHRLKEAQNTAAMLTTFNEIDVSAVVELRKSYKEQFERAHGVRLGFNSFFAKAVVQALKDVPAVNARIDGDEIVFNNFFDIGMAVSTPTGLMVPVIRDCDEKSFAEIEGSLAELAGKGRDGKLGMDDMAGGSFTITNGGVFGSLLSTPILNMPQSAIMGLHKIEERPVAVKGQVVIRPMMYVALSYDHRLIDGREAVTFLVRVKECIEDPQRLLLQM